MPIPSLIPNDMPSADASRITRSRAVAIHKARRLLSNVARSVRRQVSSSFVSGVHASANMPHTTLHVKPVDEANPRRLAIFFKRGFSKCVRATRSGGVRVWFVQIVKLKTCDLPDRVLIDLLDTSSLLRSIMLERV